MSSIDERIVSMKFDNGDFEKGVSQTLDSLDKLNKSIEENTKSNNAFSGLQNSLDKLDFSSIGDNIESIADKFNVWGIVGAKVITDLTGKVEQFAGKMAKAITGADYAKEGWTKYGQKTANVATLYSQGYDMDTVTSQLEKLMWYTDETSYNFTDMVGNIAKFTATGQDLKTSVSAMEGIANWAATAGQNATQASRAMYQLSQAMGKGALKYDDYRSIQNFSMDTQEFRKKSLEAAEALGTLKKVGTDSYVTLKGHAVDLTDFTSYMSTDMWYTSDVMMKVFNEYAEGSEEVYNYIQEVKESTGETITASEAMERLGYNMSDFKAKAFLSAQECKTFADALDALADAAGTSWMTLFETIFGGYLEAKTLWTGFANGMWQYVTAVPNALNEVMSVWKNLGGRSDLIESLVNLLNAFNHLVNPIVAGFNKIFGGANDWGSLLAKCTDSLKEFTASLKMSNVVMSYMYAGAAIFFGVIKAIFKVLTPARILAIGSALLVVKAGLAILSPTTTKLGRIIKLVQILMGIHIFTYLAKGSTTIKTIINYLGGLIEKLTGVKIAVDTSVIKGLGSDVWSVITEAIESTVTVIGTLFNALKEVGIAAKDLVKQLDLVGRVKEGWTWIKDLGKTLKTSFKDLKIEDSLVKIINTAKERALKFIEWIKTTVDELKDNEFNFTEFFADILVGASQLITDIVTLAANGLDAIFSGIGTFLDGIGFEDPFAMKAYAAEVGEDFGEVKETINDASDSAEELAESTSKVTEEATLTSTILGLIQQRFASAASLVNGLSKTVSNILSGAVDLANSFQEAINNVRTEALKEGASALDLMAAGLAAVFEVGGQINWSKVLGIAVIVLYISAVNRFSKTISGFANALNQLVKDVSPMWSTAKTTLTNMGSMFTNIGNYFTWLTKPTYTRQFKSLALSVLMLAGALGILALIPADRLCEVVVVMGLMAVAVAVCAKSFIAMSNTVKPEVIAQLSISMLALSAAFLVFVGSIKMMSSVMDKYVVGDDIWAGLGLFAAAVGSTIVSLYAFVGAIAALSMVQPALDKGAIGIAKIAASIGLLGVAMLTFNVAIKQMDTMLQYIVDAFINFTNKIIEAVKKWLSITDNLDFTAVFLGVLATLGAIAGIVAAMVATLNGLSVGIAAAGFKLSATIIAIAAAIWILTAAVDKLSQIQNVEQSVYLFAGVVIGLGAVVQSINSMGINQAMTKFGLSIMGFSAGVLLLIAALKMCKNLKPEQLQEMYNAFWLLAGAMTVLAVCCAVLDGVEIKKVAGGVLSLVAALYLLVPLIALFGVMDFAVIGQGVGLVAAMLLTLAVSVKLMEKANPGNLVKAITAVTIELVAFGLVLSALANSGASWEQIAASAAGLGVGMILIAEAALVLGDAFDNKKWSTVGKSVISIIGIAYAMTIFASAISSMQGLDWTQMAVGAASLTVAFSAMALVANLVASSFQKMDLGTFIEFIVTLGIATASMQGIAFALSMLADIPYETILAGMGGLSVTFLAMSIGLSLMTAVFNNLTAGATAIIPVLLSASVVILTLAISLNMLASVPLETFENFGAILGGVAVALAVLVAICDVFNPGAASLAAVMAALSLAFISFGAAAIMFGAGAALVGVGATLIALAFTMISNALIALMPNIASFLTYLVMLIPYAQQLGNLAGVFTALGLSFVVFGVGCAAVAVGGVLVAVALVALSAACSTTAVSITLLAAAFTILTTSISTGIDLLLSSFSDLGSNISTAFNSVKEVIEDAKTWGSDLISNFVSGITDGIDTVSTAASNIAKAVWEYIHFSVPEKGLLRDTPLFGEHLPLEYAKGIESGTQKYIPAAGEDIAQTLVTSFDAVNVDIKAKGEEASEEYYEGLTTSGSIEGFDTNVESSSSGVLDNIAEFFGLEGLKTGNTYVSGLVTAIQDGLNKLGANIDISGVMGSLGDFGGQFLELIGIDDLDETMANIQENGLLGAFKDALPEDFVYNAEDLDSVMSDLTDTTEGLSGATSDLGSSSSSAAKSTSELAEEQKKLAKYEVYSTAVTSTFLKAYGGALDIIGDTEPTEAATEAFNTLFQKIYEESQSSSDAVSGSTEDATDKIMKMKEAFIEAFESIATSVEDSIDVFTEFDKGLDEIQKPKDLIKNYKDQISGIYDFYEGLNTLALKGFSDDVISDLIEEGVDAYPKMASLLKATATEVEELNKAWDSKEAIGYEAAIMAMTARMTAIQMDSFKQQKAAHDEEQATLQAAEDAYQSYAKTANEAYSNGVDIEAELQDENSELGKSYKDLREKMEAAGLADEDLNKAMESGKGFETEDKMITTLNETLDEYREKAKAAAAEGKDIEQESLDANTELGQSYAELMEQVEACGFTVEDLYDVMYNNASFVAQYDYVQGLIDIYTNCKSVIQEFETIGDGIFDNVQSQLEGAIGYFSEFDDEFEMTADQMMQNLQSNLIGMTNYKNNLVTIAANGGGELLDLIGDEITPEYAAALATASSSTLEAMTETVKQINAIPLAGANEAQTAWFQYGQVSGMGYQEAVTQALGAEQILADMGMIGTNIDQGLANGIGGSSDLVTNAATGVGQQLVDSVKTATGVASPSTFMIEVGQYIVEGLRRGIDAGKSAVYSLARSVGTQVVTTFKTNLASSKFETIGKMICAGLEAGIRAGKSGVINAAVEVATESFAAACAALEVESPSRKMIWVGKMFDAGFAKGIDKNSGSVTNSVTEAMHGALATAYDLLVSDVDVNPTITPIIDLTDAQNGTAALSAMLMDHGFGINATLGNVTTPADLNTKLATSISGFSNSDVVSAVMSLKNDIANLGNKVASMQIVLDTGVLAGGVTEGVSQNINDGVKRKAAVWA